MTTNSNTPQAAAAKGDFYLQEGCCTSCGVPQAIAAELVGWTVEESPSCYWIRQPETPDELDRAIKIIHTQELGCHRYSGKDPTILKRLPREECDIFHPETALGYRHAFGPAEMPVKFSPFVSQANGILERLWRWLARSGG